MHRLPTRLRTAAAFTLVELLVVIGIIALLISILLPSLNAARQSAQNVKCLSNLRSIGEAINIYTAQYKGLLPAGYWNGAIPVDAAEDKTRATDWAVILTATMGKGSGAYSSQNGADSNKIQGMFSCPSARFDALSVNTRKLHYASHPRLMPDLKTVDSYRMSKLPAGSPNVFLRPYKLANIKRSAEIALIFDAMQITANDYNCNATATNLDNNGLYFASINGVNNKSWNYFLSGDGVDLSQAIYAPDGDGPDPKNASVAYNICWRHNRRDTTNLLFCDGHCSSFRLRVGQNSDAKMSNFYVDNP